MTTLALLLLIVVIVLLWQAGQHSRDIAIRTAIQTCNNQGLQFLDGTAALRQIRPAIVPGSGPVLKRIYVFDYSADGLGRRSGCIIMHNTRINAVLLQES